MDLQLDGKTALVTGASAGIGAGIALSLATEGVHVALCGRSIDGLERVASEIVVAGGCKPVVVVGDVGSMEGPGDIAPRALFALGGRLDILVSCAGGSRPILDDDTDRFWDEAFDLNFAAARRLTQLVVPDMRAAGWGRIVSVSGATVSQKLNATVPAKAALVSWSRALAFELAPHGITVNTVAPGRINSIQTLTKLHPTEQSRAEYIRQNIPAGYFGDPVDIGSLVAFLASPLARYINGAAIPVDGGAVRLAL